MTLTLIRFISVGLLILGVYGVLLSNSKIVKYKDNKDKLLRGFYGVNTEPSIDNANKMISRYLKLLTISTIVIGIQLLFFFTWL